MAAPERKLLDVTSRNQHQSDYAYKKASNDNTSNGIGRVSVKRDLTPANDNNANQTIDQAFNASYQKRGLQPSTNSFDSTSRAEVAGNFEAQNKASRPSRYVSIAGELGVTIVNGALQDFSGKLLTDENELTNAIKDHLDLASNQELAELAEDLIEDASNKGSFIARYLLRRFIWRKIALRLGLFNASWGGTFWLWVLFPLAIINTIFFGLAYVVNGLLPEMVGNGGLKIVLGMTSFIIETLEKISLHLFDFDITVIANPEAGFYVTYFLLTILGIGALLIMAGSYKMTFLHPLLGRGATAKFIFFLFSVVFFMFPILNIFPVFVVPLWLAAIWWQPR